MVSKKSDSMRLKIHRTCVAAAVTPSLPKAPKSNCAHAG